MRAERRWVQRRSSQPGRRSRPVCSRSRVAERTSKAQFLSFLSRPEPNWRASLGSRGSRRHLSEFRRRHRFGCWPKPDADQERRLGWCCAFRPRPEPKWRASRGSRRRMEFRCDHRFECWPERVGHRARRLVSRRPVRRIPRGLRRRPRGTSGPEGHRDPALPVSSRVVKPLHRGAWSVGGFATRGSWSLRRHAPCSGALVRVEGPHRAAPMQLESL